MFLIYIIVDLVAAITNIQCSEYTNRFEPIFNTQYQGQIPLSFQLVQYVNGPQGIQTQLQFTDNETYPTFNVDNQGSCVDHEFWRYSPGYGKQIQNETDTYSLESFYDDTTGLRTWEIIIPISHYSTKFNAVQASAVFESFTAYYSFIFISQGQIIGQFYFDFQIAIDLVSNSSAITSTNSTLMVPNATCSINNASNCIQQVDTQLMFCTDPTCNTQVSSLELNYGTNYSMIQYITTEGFRNYQIQNPIITYLASGLHLVRSPNFNQSSGQVILTQLVDFVWTNFSITVTSTLALPNSWRLLRKSIIPSYVYNIPILGVKTIGQISCTLYNGVCPSCDNQCTVNGFSNETCPDCALPISSNILMILVYILI